MPKTIKRNPVNPDLWMWIHHNLRMRGLTWVSLAAKFKYHPNSIKTAKTHAYPAAEKIIAEALGLEPRDLFPDRYKADGQPVGRNYPRDRRRLNLNKNGFEVNVNNQEEDLHEKKA